MKMKSIEVLADNENEVSSNLKNLLNYAIVSGYLPLELGEAKVHQEGEVYDSSAIFLFNKKKIKNAVIVQRSLDRNIEFHFCVYETKR